MARNQTHVCYVPDEIMTSIFNQIILMNCETLTCSVHCDFSTVGVLQGISQPHCFFFLFFFIFPLLTQRWPDNSCSHTRTCSQKRTSSGVTWVCVMDYSVKRQIVRMASQQLEPKRFFFIFAGEGVQSINIHIPMEQPSVWRGRGGQWQERHMGVGLSRRHMSTGQKSL